MKFIIKEMSIKDGQPNSRYLTLIQEELAKHVNGVRFELNLMNGNHSFCESNEFNVADFNYTSSPSRLREFIGNNLNFRYENFVISFE